MLQAGIDLRELARLRKSLGEDALRGALADSLDPESTDNLLGMLDVAADLDGE